MKTYIIIISAIAAITSMSACCAVHKSGEVVKHAGQGIENASGK